MKIFKVISYLFSVGAAALMIFDFVNGWNGTDINIAWVVGVFSFILSLILIILESERGLDINRHNFIRYIYLAFFFFLTIAFFGKYGIVFPHSFNYRP